MSKSAGLIGLMKFDHNFPILGIIHGEHLAARAGLSNGQTGQLPRAPGFGGPALLSTINY